MTHTLLRSCMVGLSALLLGSCLRLAAQDLACSIPLAEKQKQTITDYVRQKYKLPDTVTLSLKKDTLVQNSCFRELAFEGKSALKTWELTLYTSPDGRFLSSDLFDTTIDPALEQRLKDEALLRGLAQGANASRGPANALVTIAEFSDFQCPFCRNFALILDDALSKGEDDVRVVFHHLPLSMHPWARMAAEAAGCAQLQRNEAFWSLHDRIFQKQGEITIDNAKDKLNEMAKDAKGLDAAMFRKCMDAGMSVGLVMRDMNVADAYQINATPTVFINGHRVRGVESATKLREMIAEARKEAAVPPASAPGVKTAGTK